MYPQTLKLLSCPCEDTQCSLNLIPFQTAEDGEILEGLLTCRKCKRWFRIEEGIADIVRDELREVEDDLRFLRKHESQLTPHILQKGKPFGLKGPFPEVNSADQRLLDEGRHWGRFMRHFWDLGDRSIFDIRVKGTHPAFFVKGIAEPDDRDYHRKYGIFPNKTGRFLFETMNLFAGKRALDIGCGGGQFGLEAAQRGLTVIGFDPSFEEIRLGRIHARSQGITNIDYVRAYPSHPPFRKRAFHLLLAKDSLHHVPDLKDIFPKLAELATVKGRILLIEHIAHPRFKGWLFSKIDPPLTKKIRRRYPNIEIPPELQSDSANEDVGMETIIPLLGQHADRISHRHELFLANDMEMYIHYAYGKRRWFSRFFYRAIRLVEPVLVILGERQHYCYFGRLKTPSRPES